MELCEGTVFPLKRFMTAIERTLGPFHPRHGEFETRSDC